MNSIVESPTYSVAPFTPHLEEILGRASRKNKHLFNIVGTQSTAAISMLLSQNLSLNFNNLPNLVITSSLEEAELLSEQIQFFSPHFLPHILKPFDVSPYSGLYSSPQVSWDRSAFIYWAQNASAGFKNKNSDEKIHIFIAPVSALQQLTAPYFNFHKRCQKIEFGQIKAQLLPN